MLQRTLSTIALDKDDDNKVFEKLAEDKPDEPIVIESLKLMVAKLFTYLMGMMIWKAMMKMKLKRRIRMIPMSFQVS